VKLCGLTVNVNAVVTVVEPDVAATVKTAIPAGAVLATVSVNRLVAE
jgi:hypothetical protein